MGIEAPTGDEQPQKYYASPYLDDVEKFQDASRNAVAVGEDVNTEDVHPLTLQAVAPHLLTDEQKEYMRKGISEGVVSNGAGQTSVEANGDEDHRVEQGVDAANLQEGTKNDTEDNDKPQPGADEDGFGGDAPEPERVDTGDSDTPTFKL